MMDNPHHNPFYLLPKVPEEILLTVRWFLLVLVPQKPLDHFDVPAYSPFVEVFSNSLRILERTQKQSVQNNPLIVNLYMVISNQKRLKALNHFLDVSTRSQNIKT